MYSVSIMACKEREHYIPYLKKQLGDVPVSMDEGDKGIWNNCKDSWLLHDPSKEWHIVLQDDSIVPDDFHKHTTELFNKLGGKDYVVSLYAGYRLEKRIERARSKNQDNVIFHRILNENALAIRTKHIDSMIKYSDMRQATTDRYIQSWARNNNLMMYYPIPSLINHRDDRSVYREKFNKLKPDSVRQAVWYIDDKKHI